MHLLVRYLKNLSNKYLIISNRENQDLSWQKQLQETIAVCPNYKAAYFAGLSVGDIKDPNKSYRVSLETIKRDGGVRIKSKTGYNEITIIKIKEIKYY